MNNSCRENFFDNALVFITLGGGKSNGVSKSLLKNGHIAVVMGFDG